MALARAVHLGPSLVVLSDDLVKRVGAGLGSTLILFGLAPIRASKSAAGRALERFGQASYALYLLHYVVLAVLQIAVGKRAIALLGTPLYFIVTAALATLSGVVFHVCVERPLLAWLRLRLGEPSKTAP
jgi:exopolysaccharide production protein ExoZ